ncbi:MAG: nucleoside deaminase [Candidatus Saccharimonas sp.]
MFMDRAIELSNEGMNRGEGGPFGACIVLDGKIIAEGNNRVIIDNDPTAHAEVVAIRRAAETLNRFDLSDCEIYTSCEPCPMCLGSIYWARLKAVYYANDHTDAARIGFDDSLIYDELATPIHDRQIHFEKIDNPRATEVFDQWAAKTDKTRY